VCWLVAIVITSGLLDDTTMSPHAAQAIDATTKVMFWLPSSRGFQLAGMSRGKRSSLLTTQTCRSLWGPSTWSDKVDVLADGLALAAYITKFW
jgi:hypothetical protein